MTSNIYPSLGGRHSAMPQSAKTNSAVRPAAAKPVKHECGIHSVVYEAVRPGCPVCSLERDVENLRRQIAKLGGELEMSHSSNRQLQIEVDIVSAIRQACDVLDDEDLAFLKIVLYQYRDEKSVGLKTTHGSKKKRGQPPANGFIAMPRSGDPYGHVCSSVEGIAIAGYFDEATNTVGQIKATDMLVRGMSAHLPGSTQ